MKVSADSNRPSRATHSPNQDWLFGLFLVLAVVFAYQPAWNAGFIWDDDLYVTQNPLLTAPDGLKRIWFSLDSPSQYFPLVYTTFRFERALWGLHPAGYHWVNILLHAANACLLWALLRRLALPGAWLAAALFALHPVNVESVAWITERKNVLTLLFSLLATLAWVRFVDEPVRRWRFYALAVLCYSLALFSKTTACTLPVAFLLILWLKKKPINRQRLAEVAPFFLIGLAMGLLTVWWEHHHQGVEGKFAELGILERVLIANRAVWFYLGKLIWPANLAFSYPRWNIDPSNPLAYGWLLACIAVAAAILFARRRMGRSLEVAALFYVATLGPMLGFFMLATFRYSFVADHYQYVASIGILALAAAGITKGLAVIARDRPFLKPAVCGTLLFVLGILTWRQCGMYKDLETLWRTTLKRNPQSFMAHNNLGLLLFARGEVDEAIVHYQKAREIQPDADLIAYNLGNAFFAKRQLDEAILWYRKALEAQPDGAAIVYGLGNALFAKGQTDEAIANYRKALELQPDGAAIVNTLGNALLAKGDVDEAVACFRKALQLAPGMARAHSDLAGALVRKGRLSEAIAEYEAALQLQPANVAALANLSWVLATGPDPSLRNGPRAVELAQQAHQLSGGKSPEVLRILSAACAEAGRFPDAIAAAEFALQMPNVRANPVFADKLRAQIETVRSGSAIRDPALTNSAPGR